MSTPDPLEAESRASHARAASTHAKFAEHVAKVSTPQPAAPQREPNAQAAAAAKAMQLAKNPDGSRKHTPVEIQAAWQRAYETPVSAGPNAQPASGYISANQPPGMMLVVRDGRVQSVPDPSYKPTGAEPDAFSSQHAARTAELGPTRAAQNAQLDRFLAAVNPETGERFAKEDPRFLANVEAARAKLFAGEDLADTIAATEARLAESKYAQSVKVEGFTIAAPEGYELDANEIARHVKAARAAGISNEQFQALVTEHVLGAAHE